MEWIFSEAIFKNGKISLEFVRNTEKRSIIFEFPRAISIFNESDYFDYVSKIVNSDNIKINGDIDIYKSVESDFLRNYLIYTPSERVDDELYSYLVMSPQECIEIITFEDPSYL